MEISFDPAKRAATLKARGLDFLDVGKVFDGRTVTARDDRYDYGEDRYITFGYLDGIAVVVVFTWRRGGMRVISMRRAHREEMQYVGMD